MKTNLINLLNCLLCLFLKVDCYNARIVLIIYGGALS